MTHALRFAREAFNDALLAEMLPLLERHWAEVAHYTDIPLCVDASVYHAAEANGALRIYTARRETTVRTGPFPTAQRQELNAGVVPVRGQSERVDQLVGYAVFFVRSNPHYALSVQAVQDVIYVAPESRGNTGARLIQFADDELREEGAQAVYHHVKTAHNWGKLLERMGYEAVDVIYAKRLDRD